ncbi:MAG: AAA family ATPase [Amphiplicatus sp.]
MEALGRPRHKTRVIGPDGWPVEQAKPAGWVDRDDLYWPKDLKPSRPRLVIVAGAPASGKSTYVAERVQRGDLIINSDLEAQRLGVPAFSENWGDRVRMLKARNDRLRELATSNAERAWFMALLGRPEDRAHFAGLLKPAEIVVIFTPAEECARRIRATRPNAAEAMFQAVQRWHVNYCPRPGETTLKGWGR